MPFDRGAPPRSAMTQLPEQIQQTLESANIPSPSPVLVRLMQLADDDGSTTGDVAALVERDPGLAVRVLGIANSPALGRGRELRSIEHCVAALGTRLVRSIATCLSIQRLFEQQAGQASLDLGPFWGHSLLVGELARSIALATDGLSPDEAYLAGLLHDVGQLVLLGALGAGYRKLLASVPDEGQLATGEMAGLQFSHADVAAWLVDRWALDSTLGDGMLFHHAAPELIATASPLAQTVWMAHVLATESDPAQAMARIESAWLACGTVDGAGLIATASAQVRQIAEAMGLGLPDALVGLPLWGNLPADDVPAAPPAGADAALARQVGARALLQPLQADVTALEDEAEILAALREAARILFGVGRSAFLLVREEDGVLNGAGIGAQPLVFRQARVPLTFERSRVVMAAQERRPCTSFEAAESGAASLIDVQFARALGASGILCLPLVDGGGLLGVMVCGIAPTDHERLKAQGQWLLGFARIAAQALGSLRLVVEAQAAVRADVTAQFVHQGRRVIHEAGNPLGIIKTYLALIDRKLPEGVQLHEELGVLREELDRVSGIVERLSEVPVEAAPEAGVDLGELVRELLALYRMPLFESRDIRLELALPKQPVRVRCERNSLKQMVLNLLKNASEALAAGNRLRLALRPQVLHAGEVRVLLEIEDNGPGMPAAAMQSLAGAAPVTLGARRGHGLSIVGELARRQGIIISVRSDAGQGTCTSLLLPPPIEQAPAATGGKVWSGVADGLLGGGQS